LGLDIHWAFKDTKLSFYLDAPGFNARIRWQCRVKDSAVAWTDNTDPENPIYHRGLSFNVSDYEGAVNHGSMADPEPGWTIHWWTFEPSGKLCDPADARTPLERYQQGVGLVVDPYLSVDEQSTYINVLCDGYIFRIGTDPTYGALANIWNTAGTTQYYQELIDYYENDNTYYYYLGYDSNRITTIIENTPQRVKIRIKGRLDRTSGATNNYLTNHSYTEIIYTIYPDRVTADQKWVFSGNISASSWQYSTIGGVSAEAANLTGENGYYENSGSESEASDSTEYNSADYLAILATEINYQWIVLYTDFNDHQKHNHDANQSNFWDDNPLTSGTYYHRAMYIIDSASREGSAKIYDSTDRLAMGDQYKDLEIDLTEGGSRVFARASSQYLKNTGTASVTAAPLGIGLWLKLTSLPSSGEYYNLVAIQESGGSSGNEDDFHVFIYNNSGTYELTIQTTAAGSDAMATLNITSAIGTTNWHYIFGRTTSIASREVFMDDTWSSENTTSRTPSGLDETSIGSNWYGEVWGAFVNGKIRGVHIYNVALSNAIIM
jgi:hypothetical protein